MAKANVYFDFYVGIGAVYNYLAFKGDFGSTLNWFGSVGLATIFGANYFLADWFALKLELASWAFSGGIKAGILFKI